MNYGHGVKMVCAVVLWWTSTVRSMGDDTTKKFLQGFVRGSGAGMMEILVNQPLITMKNDLQQGKKPTLRLSHLYRGFGVNLSTIVPITAMQMSCFELFKRGLQEDSSQNLSENKKLLAAALSGALSAGVSSPSELVMIQQQKYNASLMQTMCGLKASHGSRVLLRGMELTALREAGFTVAYLAGGPALSNRFADAGLPESLATVMGGSCAGLVAAVATQPIDTIKTKIQADLTKNVSAVWPKSARTLYAGFTPRATRIVMATTVMSAVNKELERMMEQ